MGLFDFLKKEKDVILGVEFPRFNGKQVWSTSKNYDKYKRNDYYYRPEPDKLYNYTELVYSYGFRKLSEKKYVKDNSYIIIENKDDRLHIAFQVNK